MNSIMADFDPKELKNSKRIFKSATPKYTLDWYIKWVASIFVLSAMSLRGIDGLQMFDLGLGMTLKLIIKTVSKICSLLTLIKKS